MNFVIASDASFIQSQSHSRLWQAIKVEDVPDDLTPFITRTTQDHINGGAFGDVWKCNYNTDGISAVVSPCFRLVYHAPAYADQLITRT